MVGYKLVLFLVIVTCVAISLQNLYLTTYHSFHKPSQTYQTTLLENRHRNASASESLKFHYYRESCPSAELIIRSTVAELYKSQPEIAPAIIRLVFHDCFPQGCDASVMLDRTGGLETETQAPPNLSLQHLDAIDLIKSKLEDACPGVVSCADIIMLAARDSVVKAGGPFYRLTTGRKDSTEPSFNKAMDLPKPDDTHSLALNSFASRGFSARETVALLGAHSTGKIHCGFLTHRLLDFHGNNTSDPEIDPTFLETMRSTCNFTNPRPDSPFKPPPQTSSPFKSPQSPFKPPPSPFKPPPSPFKPPLQTSSASRCLLEAPSKEEEPFMKMDFEGARKGFGTLYYQSLLQRRGILFVDQQLMANKETASWVRAYAANASLFRKDFVHAMTKLSNLQVLTAPRGQVRLNCHKVN